MWEAIYAYFYNKDWSLYLVLIVYDLVELIIEDQEDTWSQNPTVHKHSNFFVRMMN